MKGVSILAADGDDGAPSLAAASGNCPMDHTKVCEKNKNKRINKNMVVFKNY